MECCCMENKDSNYFFTYDDSSCCQNKTTTIKKRRYPDCRVKFGVPLDQVCKRDIPGPLLVSALILNTASDTYHSMVIIISILRNYANSYVSDYILNR